MTYWLNLKVSFVFLFVGFKPFKRLQQTGIRLVEMRIGEIYGSVLKNIIN